VGLALALALARDNDNHCVALGGLMFVVPDHILVRCLCPCLVFILPCGRRESWIADTLQSPLGHHSLKVLNSAQDDGKLET